MENQEIKEQGKFKRPKRRISLFKRRKKSDLRPFIREKKNRQYKNFLSYFIIGILFLFLASLILFTVKEIAIPKIFINNTQMLNPQGSSVLDNNQVENLIMNKGFEVSDIRFPKDSLIVTFVLHKNTLVYLSLEKDIASELDLIEAIDRQMVVDSKQAISIDLRYNKPIVKF